MNVRDPVRIGKGAAGAVVILVLGACSPPAASRLPSEALDTAIARRIGDPATCVLIAERRTRRVVYRYGDDFNCVRGLPACDRPGAMSAREALALADAYQGRGASCASSPDGSRTVGWAEGRAVGARHELIYSAVMEGQTALPGREIASRLAQAFAAAGL